MKPLDGACSSSKSPIIFKPEPDPASIGRDQAAQGLVQEAETTEVWVGQEDQCGACRTRTNSTFGSNAPLVWSTYVLTLISGHQCWVVTSGWGCSDSCFRCHLDPARCCAPVPLWRDPEENPGVLGRTVSLDWNTLGSTSRARISPGRGACGDPHQERPWTEQTRSNVLKIMMQLRPCSAQMTFIQCVASWAERQCDFFFGHREQNDLQLLIGPQGRFIIIVFQY